MVTSLTAPDSNQKNVSPLKRMADIIDERLLFSITVFSGVLIMRFLALWFLMVHPLTVNVGFHVLFSTTSPFFKSEGMAFSKVRSMYVSFNTLTLDTVLVSALAGDGCLMNHTSSPGAANLKPVCSKCFNATRIVFESIILFISTYVPWTLVPSSSIFSNVHPSIRISPLQLAKCVASAVDEITLFELGGRTTLQSVIFIFSERSKRYAIPRA